MGKNNMRKASESRGAADAAHQVVLAAVHATVQQGVVEIDAERCKGCGLCADECPAHTLRLSTDVNLRGYHFSTQAEPDRCIGCASCALICPDACIEVYRTSVIPQKYRKAL